jgi:hypothetical protein
MIEQWPDPAVEYEYPEHSSANEQRWRDGINQGLADGSLTLSRRPLPGDFYDLTGSCPRCGHHLSQPIEFGVILGALPVREKAGVFNVKCNCTQTHNGRDDKHTGCGWGGALDVPLSTRQ